MTDLVQELRLLMGYSVAHHNIGMDALSGAIDEIRRLRIEEEKLNKLILYVGQESKRDRDASTHQSGKLEQLQDIAKIITEFTPNHCDHYWQEARNVVVTSGEHCIKCRKIVNGITTNAEDNGYRARKVCDWLEYWREKLPNEAVEKLQDILGPLS